MVSVHARQSAFSASRITCGGDSEHRSGNHADPRDNDHWPMVGGVLRMAAGSVQLAVKAREVCVVLFISPSWIGSMICRVQYGPP